MGRQPNAPQIDRHGFFACWHPGIKKRVNLGTKDYATACAIQAGFYGRTSVPSPPSKPDPTPVGNPTFPYNPGAQTMTLDLDDKPTDAASILSQWSKNSGNTSDGTSTPVGQTPAAPPNPSPTLTLPWIQPSNSQGMAPVSRSSRKLKPSLTPEQSAQLASGLKKIVANLNVIIVGAGVQMFGKVPAPLDDDEVKMLEMGWAMFIDELFLKSEVKPWHVLLAGNVMIAAAMYVGGTPIPRKALPPNDPTKAKSSNVTPIDGGKPNV